MAQWSNCRFDNKNISISKYLDYDYVQVYLEWLMKQIDLGKGLGIKKREE